MLQIDENLPPRYGYVILVDALGTKGATAHMRPQALVDRWQAFIKDVEDWTEKVNLKSGSSGSVAKSIPFSDTAFICIEPRKGENDYVTDVIWLDDFASILRDAISVGIFLRGAISYGLYYHKNSQVFGPAVEEAAAWYEETDWIGVSATPSLGHVLDLLERKRGAVKSSFFVKHEVPFKRPELKRCPMWALGWPLTAAEQDDVKGEVQTAFIHFGGSVSPAVYPKFRNTLEFIKTLRESEHPTSPSNE